MSREWSIGLSQVRRLLILLLWLVMKVLSLFRTPSFVVANAMIIGCNSTSDIVLIAANCTNIQHPGQAQLVHVDFANNSLLNHGSLINRQGALGTHLSLEDAEFRQNSCDGKGCVLLSSSSTLRNIIVLQNRKKGISFDDCSMFSVQEGSQVYVRNMSIVSNEIRGFHVNRSSLTIRESFFGEKKGKRHLIPPFEAYKGGVLLAEQSVVAIQRSTFANNSASMGGAIYASSCKMSIENCLFHKNNAMKDRGGAIAITKRTSIRIKESSFLHNKAKGNGGTMDASEECEVNLTNVESVKNIAGGHGGSIHFHTRTKVVIVNSAFSGNQAQFGGGMYARLNSDLKISNSYLIENRAEGGGCIFMELSSNMTIDKSVLKNNTAMQKGGAIGINSNSRLYASNVTIRDNKARMDCGGIDVSNGSFLNATRMSVISNSANDNAGGVGIFSESSFLCYACFFEENSAHDGAGLYVHSSNKTSSTVAQLQDCLFFNNSASCSGGGLMFEAPQNNVQNISHKGAPYGHVISLNTIYVSNFATQFGSAILATNIEDILVSCFYNGGRQTDFLDQGDLALLACIDPEHLCESWKGNRQASSSTKGVVGTFGKKISLSINSTNSLNDVQLSETLTSGFILKNVRSGERLPEIRFMVVDAFGNGPATTVPRSFLVTIISPDTFFQGVLTINITSGRGRISGIIGFKSPGYYTIKITPQVCTIGESTLKISVRSWYIGEEPTNAGELCQTCESKLVMKIILIEECL